MVSEVQVDDERVARELLKVGDVMIDDGDGNEDVFRMIRECEEEEEDGEEETDGEIFMPGPPPRR